MAENYPDLRATENFQQLSRQLSELEDEIQASRRIYNSNVQSYNTSIQQFPGSIIANQGSFGPREFFEIEDAAEREPVAGQLRRLRAGDLGSFLSSGYLLRGLGRRVLSWDGTHHSLRSTAGARQWVLPSMPPAGRGAGCTPSSERVPVSAELAPAAEGSLVGRGGLP